ncbi:MAG: dihydropteroate synthase [Geminicoccaceae bacterium]
MSGSRAAYSLRLPFEVSADSRIYLRPLGPLTGPGARAALDGGWGLPLMGEGAAFTGAELWFRSGKEASCAVLSAAELRTLAARGELPSFAFLLHRLGAPPGRPERLPDRRPLVMGVLNVTPDSFSDGGRFLEPAAAIEHGLRLHAEGADLIDVGGESTRPGAAAVSAEQELERVASVVEALARAGILVSIDTRKAAVMRAAVAAGARVINDISALAHDPESLQVAGASGLPVVLMHMQGEPATMQQQPHYDHAALDVYDYLEERIRTWTDAGFDRARLLVDPGIGFGKTIEHNLDILSRLGLYLGLGVPLVLGVSRKSFIAPIAGEASASERVFGSLAAALSGVAQGVAVLRVHDVAATQQAVRIWRATSI